MWIRSRSRLAKAMLVLMMGSISQVGLASSPLVGDGNPIYFNNLGLVVPVPDGWQISSSGREFSLSLKEPERRRALQTEEDRHRREVTFRQDYETVVIDEQQIERLKAELKEIYAADFDSFQISEDIKIINHRGENDAILAYSFAMQGEQAITMMHVLLAGELNRVLITADHLASSFEQQMDDSWQLMSGIEIIGVAPDFWANWHLIIKGGGAFLVLLILGALLRRWRVRRWLKMSDLDGSDWFDDQASPGEEIATDQDELVALSARAKRVATRKLPQPPSEQVHTKKVVAKKVGRPARPKLPPPPVKKAASQSFDPNLEDDWQLVSGHDDLY